MDARREDGDTLMLPNALLYVPENGCKWRAVSRRFGRWHTVYLSLSRWGKAESYRARFYSHPIRANFCPRIEAVGLDSTSVRVHPDGTGTRK